jgi:hypothetical protein
VRYPQQFGQSIEFGPSNPREAFPSWVQIVLALGGLFLLAAIVVTLYGTRSPLADEPRQVTVATTGPAVPPTAKYQLGR